MLSFKKSLPEKTQLPPTKKQTLLNNGGGQDHARRRISEALKIKKRHTVWSWREWTAADLQQQCKCTAHFLPSLKSPLTQTKKKEDYNTHTTHTP